MSAPALAVRAAVPERDVEVELTVPAGRVLALLGPNGAGKSTVLGLAAGTVRPGSGEVRVAGRRVAGEGAWVPPHARRISLLAQEPLLLPHLDVLANVAFGPRARGVARRAADELARTRLAEVGAEALAERRVHRLSGGQAQRVALARALAPDPHLLLLDEPLSALDVDAAAQLRQVLRAALRGSGRTAVVVTHDLLDVLALADDVVVLEAGRVVEQGTTAEVLGRPRSGFGARLAGVNLLLGERVAADAVRAGDDVVHGLASAQPATTCRAAAAFSPRAVAVHRAAPGGSPRNVLPARVTGLEQQGALVRVRGETASGSRLAADVTPASLSALRIGVGDDVVLVVKAAEVEIYDA
ncbi:sulfate/molybdate ABC transporter ATP-binding protein [Oceanitalea stevensii]|uniref:ABC transporter ATP-binding protein n=1 Tax=Oceanitalea stevensii TaxID=2763072 RepID=A0ABR8Z2T8_9MICO|nr:ABC transporter ATP-binding protein [Oceanitalea stevensii]MBD8062648.1 ABC transporter ATP-binding protein [Oceanitalea stevensii]